MQIGSLGQLREFAAEFIREFDDTRLLILLDGPMGAGKTQFTKFLLEALGSDEAVSPSFAIHNSYQTRRRLIHHYDLFRLNNADDLESTGFWECFESADEWVIIEWSVKLNEFNLYTELPVGWRKVHLTFTIDKAGDARRVDVKRLF